MNSPKVSIVIPTYNSSATIREALESVAVQTYSDYEVIVVDDASADNTVEVTRCAMRDEGWGETADSSRQVSAGRLIVLEENVGPAGARNRGIAEARGEWIAFLDGDDVWAPWKLDHQLSVLASHPEVGMLCGGLRSFRSDSHLEESLTAPPPEQADVDDVPLTDFVENNPVATSTVMVRRDLLKEVGAFDSQFRGPEDLDLWLRIAARTRIVMTKAVVSFYRHVPCSLSMDDRTFLPEVLRVLDKAFADGGALAGYRELKSKARSTQYWNASWMAFGRADKATALGYWAKAWWLNVDRNARVRRPWFRLLLRYLATLPKTCGGCG